MRLRTVLNNPQARGRAISRIAGMSAIWPYRCTGTIAAGRAPGSPEVDRTAASRRSTSMRNVPGSMSTSTGTAPVASIAAIVATAVCETVNTASPVPTPRARSASSKASVPLPTPTQSAAPRIGGELRLECVDLRAKDVRPALQHAVDGDIDLRPSRSVGATRGRLRNETRHRHRDYPSAHHEAADWRGTTGTIGKAASGVVAQVLAVETECQLEALAQGYVRCPSKPGVDERPVAEVVADVDPAVLVRKLVDRVRP